MSAKPDAHPAPAGRGGADLLDGAGSTGWAPRRACLQRCGVSRRGAAAAAAAAAGGGRMRQGGLPLEGGM
eukprot:scaffold415_cov362-Prasinococcus_capsulatus_cf.AAC.5